MFRKRIAPPTEGGERDTARLEAFSDGVFAIAITLLILEIHIPEFEEGKSLWRALADLWPSYFGYAVSFLVIGIMWVNHHNVFRIVRRVDHWVLVFNLLLLFCVAFIPFPTAVLAAHIDQPDESTAVVFYAGAFVVTAIAFNLLWRYPVKRAPWLLEPDADPRAIASITRRYTVGPLIYLGATIIGWFFPTAGLIALALIALLYLIPLDFSE
ncbi:MAG TPA: TMEM175 family protein [Thermomicrobiales bacterium]|nr:TMEM175 family protein [Thermomicrobiales bacterium]